MLMKLSYLLLAGLTNGSVYGLIGLSLSIIYGSSRVINFAQGEFVMLGAMSAVLFMVTLALPWPVAMLAMLAVVVIAALALDYGVYRPLIRRKAAPLTIMIGTLAGAIIVYGLAFLIWGPDQRYVPPVLSLEPIRIGFLITNPQQISLIVIFVVFLLATWYILYRTRFGLSVRATGVNPRVALLMGIRSERIVQFSFIFSAFISGVAGMMVGPLLGGHVGMGLLLTVKGFMAAILGGLGSPFAAAAGGLAIGMMEALMAGFGTSLYAEPAIFVLILLVLIVRPYGLLGDYEAERR
ncbi:branched-chain amino acid ABC transporter permease [Kumtagia ephedrae]|jgi:branched-chain amino acid transport system permease protein|uniref:Branched-chain amino acid ABC transporter permease n=1 Tax=Kumtagia ephedrae TaxID=2116701 RepID=A0A2P7S5P8_9HYPH|nr:branched-chain amino acid ABC transporter permease [Mesorhizobium ephedrae]PSJ57787.1 branched-chain amino acid ABC transporter permease [Mesorhizobium ephedrae]